MAKFAYFPSHFPYSQALTHRALGDRESPKLFRTTYRAIELSMIRLS